MALTDESNGGIPATMLVGPTGYANAPYPYPMMYGNSSGNNAFGGDWAWIILLLLLGWGNNGNGFGGGMGGGGLYPWLNNSNQINDGFRDSMMNDNITEIRSGVTSLASQLCNCCADMAQTVNSAQSAITQQLYTNQLSDLERSFASQTATTQGFMNLQSQLAQCCCDNRLATAQLEATVARENCADREALNYSTRDIIASQTAGIQRILDQMCNDKIDSKNEKIAELQAELLYARGQASQDVQTARILAGQTSEVDALYNRLNNCPVGTVPVYGRQPIFSCTNNQGCGCGCGNGF